MKRSNELAVKILELMETRNLDLGDSFNALCILVAAFIRGQEEHIRARMWEEFVSRTTELLNRQDTG